MCQLFSRHLLGTLLPIFNHPFDTLVSIGLANILGYLRIGVFSSLQSFLFFYAFLSYPVQVLLYFAQGDAICFLLRTSF